MKYRGKAGRAVSRRAWHEGSDGVSNEDLDAKPGGDEPVVRRGAPQLDVQELELNQ